MVTVRRTTTLLSAPLSAPLSALVLLAGCSDPAPPASAPSTRPSAASNTVSPPRFDALEQEFGARLGVFAVDTGSGRTVEHRADERFAFASTYKALAAAAVLDSGADLATRIPVTDLVDHSPVTGEHVGGTMSLGEVAEAAVTVSDNTAGNLLFDQLGGPTGFEADLRALGDTVTESARTEPGLNRWNPGEVDDTSSPRAFAADLRAYAVGETLDAADRTSSPGGCGGTRPGRNRSVRGFPRAGSWATRPATRAATATRTTSVSCGRRGAAPRGSSWCSPTGPVSTTSPTPHSWRGRPGLVVDALS